MGAAIFFSQNKLVWGLETRTEKRHSTDWIISQSISLKSFSQFNALQTEYCKIVLNRFTITSCDLANIILRNQGPVA